MKNEKGFTLIELLIVIAIIGILSAVATTAYVGSMKKAARSEAYANLETLRLLQEQFYAENGDYAVSANYNATSADDGGIEDLLTGFKPGGCRADGGAACPQPFGLNYTYQIIQNVELPGGIIAVPYDGANVARIPCFIAIAQGFPGTRICPAIGDPNCDVFVIDCMNKKNY